MFYFAYTCHDNALVFTGKKKIRNVHCFNSLVVTAGEIICQQYIFWVVVVNGEQALIFTLFCSLVLYLLRYLDIDYLVLAACHEIYLAISGLADIDGITPAAQFKVHNIFKACCHGVGIISEHAVSQRGIGEVEFLLRFQDFLSLEVIA